MEQTEILLPVVVLPVINQIKTDRTEPKHKSFIEANTIVASFDEMKHHHIIPVFVRDNEPLISHADFIGATYNQVCNIFSGEQILKPEIRVSHPVKGRVPDAKDKPAHLLTDLEKTIYYERMAFVIEIPSIQSVIDGNVLSLIVGGVKSYNSDNLYSRNVGEQHFKIFIGFQNKVCTNLCVWTDGYMDDVKVKNAGQLKSAIRTLLEGYNKNYHLHHLNKLTEFSITEQEFAQLVGRCKMYIHLPIDLKADLPAIMFGENQLSSVVKDFYKDESFCRDNSGNINLWRLYNLFTGANKSSYIDSFLQKSVNAFDFVETLRICVQDKTRNWYLS